MSVASGYGLNPSSRCRDVPLGSRFYKHGNDHPVNVGVAWIRLLQVTGSPPKSSLLDHTLHVRCA